MDELEVSACRSSFTQGGFWPRQPANTEEGAPMPCIQSMSIHARCAPFPSDPKCLRPRPAAAPNQRAMVPTDRPLPASHAQSGSARRQAHPRAAPRQAGQGSTHVYVDSTRASHNTSAAAPSNSHRTQLVSNQRSKPVAWPQNLTHRGGGRVSSPSRGLEPSTGEHAGAPRATKQRERRRRVGGWWSHPVRPRVGG